MLCESEIKRAFENDRQQRFMRNSNNGIDKEFWKRTFSNGDSVDKLSMPELKNVTPLDESVYGGSDRK